MGCCIYATLVHAGWRCFGKGEPGDIVLDEFIKEEIEQANEEDEEAAEESDGMDARTLEEAATNGN